MAVKKGRKSLTKIEKARLDTLKDIKKKLNLKGRVLIARPTGFGKTWQMTELAKEYNKVLYVYPTKAIKNTVVEVYLMSEDDDENDSGIVDEDTFELAKQLSTLKNVDMMSYKKVQMMSKKDVDNLPEYDLIIFDEAHVMGAKKTSAVIDKIFEKYVPFGCHIVGATASPNRMDGFDIVDHYFNNIMVYPYTLHDAFKDGVLQKPIYYYMTYNVDDIKKNLDKNIKKEILKEGIPKDKAGRREIHDLIDASIVSGANILEMDNVVKTACNKHLKNTSYMKFIVFFSSFKSIRDNRDQVKGWFKSAFPNHTINILDVTSETKEKKNNVDKLKSMTYKDNHIDLIFCVNMLTMGYHVDDLTGIMMYRGTISDIIYIQQLGRGLSSSNSNQCLVFDVVDNLHRKAVYGMGRASKIRKVAGKTGGNIVPVTDQVKKLLSDEDVKNLEKNPEFYHVEEHNGKLMVIGKDKYWDSVEGIIKDAWWRDMNAIKKEDLVVDGIQAMYSEIIAKAVAEPISFLCRETIILHFKRWCMDNKKKNPINKQEYIKLLTESEDDYRRDFERDLKNNNLGYPMNDALELMHCTSVPLNVLAKEQGVRIEAILKTLGISVTISNPPKKTYVSRVEVG